MNGLSTSVQTFASSTAGTDFSITSSGSTHTFNLPTASASNRGLLSPIDWNAFNAKASTTLANTWSALQTFGNNISFGGARLNIGILTQGDLMSYNGTNWVNIATSSLGISSILTFATTTDYYLHNIEMWGDSLTLQTGQPLQNAMAPVGYTVVYNGWGGQGSTSIKNHMLMGTSTFDNLTIIWAGVNNANTMADYSTVTADIDAMVAALASAGNTSHFLVLSLLDGSADPLGSTSHTVRDALAAHWASEFPNNYYDINSYLISQYNPALPQDVIDYGNGIIASSLRADSIHLSPIGVTLFANKVRDVILAYFGNQTDKSLSYNSLSNIFAAPLPLGMLTMKPGSPYLMVIPGNPYQTSVLQASTSLNNYFAWNSGTVDGTGSNNVGFGGGLAEILTGSNNTGVGMSSLHLTQSGNGNSALGYQALASTNADYNTGIGYYALINNTTGTHNVVVGDNLMTSNISGSFNKSFGSYNLGSATSSSYQLAFGDSVLGYSIGNYNIGIGSQAGSGNNIDTANRAGSNNIFIGYQTGVTASSSNYSNSIALGKSSLIGASNALIIGGTGTNALNVGIGTSSPTNALEVVGNGYFSGSIITSSLTSTSTATSSFSGPVKASCFTVDGSTCITGGAGLSGGSAGALTYWSSATTVGATTSPVVGYLTATSTATSKFSGTIVSPCFSNDGSTCIVGGGASIAGGTTGLLTVWSSPTTVTATASPVVGYITATSTTGTSTFAGNIISTGGLGSEMTPSLTSGNWTLGSYWRYLTSPNRIDYLGSIPNPGTTFYPTTPLSVTAGTTYQIVITISALSSYNQVRVSIGGSQPQIVTSAGTYTLYFTAQTTGNLFVGTNTSNRYGEITISSISVMPITSGNLAVNGNLTANGQANFSQLKVNNSLNLNYASILIPSYAGDPNVSSGPVIPIIQTAPDTAGLSASFVFNDNLFGSNTNGWVVNGGGLQVHALSGSNVIDLRPDSATTFSLSGPNTGTTLNINTGGSLNATFGWDNVTSGGFNSFTSGARPYRFLGATSYSFPSNVGIGTTSPSAKFSIVGDANGTVPLIAIASTTGNATTTVFQIDQNGLLTMNTPGATSTINGNLYVNGALRSTTSYNGDLFFANNFRIYESDLNPSLTQSLLWQNQHGQDIMKLDENGNLNLTGDICANNVTCVGKSLETLSASMSALASTTARGQAYTFSDLNSKIDALTLNIGITTSDLQNRVSSLESLSSTTASSTAVALNSSPSFIQAIASTVLDLIKSIGNLVVNSLTAVTGVFTHVQSNSVQTDSVDSKTIHTDTLCADDVCINKDQLKALLIQAGGVSSSSSHVSATATTSIITATTTENPLNHIAPTFDTTLHSVASSSIYISTSTPVIATSSEQVASSTEQIISPIATSIPATPTTTMSVSSSTPQITTPPEILASSTESSIGSTTVSSEPPIVTTTPSDTSSTSSNLVPSSVPPVTPAVVPTTSDASSTTP